MRLVGKWGTLIFMLWLSTCTSNEIHIAATPIVFTTRSTSLPTRQPIIATMSATATFTPLPSPTPINLFSDVSIVQVNDYEVAINFRFQLNSIELSIGVSVPECNNGTSWDFSIYRYKYKENTGIVTGRDAILYRSFRGECVANSFQMNVLDKGSRLVYLQKINIPIRLRCNQQICQLTR